MNKIVRTKRPHRWRALDALAADADQIVERHDNLKRLRRKLMDAHDENKPIDLAASKDRAALDEHDATVLARCHAALALLDPDESYENDDGDCGLRRSVVGERLALLAGAFPNGAPGDPEIYAAMMLESVCTIEDGFTLLALDATCRELISTKKFLPTVSEVLEVAHAQASLWMSRIWAINELPDLSRLVVERIEAMQGEASAAAREVDRERRHLIVLQEAAARIAEDIAAGFERLVEATQKLQAIGGVEGEPST